MQDVRSVEVYSKVKTHVMSAGHYLIFLAVTGNLFVSGLLETGQNVIKKTRLIKVLDKYPTNWITDWNCETEFPVETCQRVRKLQIDIELVYILTEELVCRAGWSFNFPTDSGCSSPCQADSYGENCAFKCRCLYGRNCDPVDGSCDCYDGWTGPGCYTRCAEGEFGPNCKDRAHICENRGINHPVSGECLCPDGYRGERCEIECNPFTDSLCGFDCELCDQTNFDYCDFIVSSCRCKSGWRGLYCTEPCAPGSSGLFCHDFCCSGIGFCDEERSRCLCLDGYSGDNCEDKCEDGFFGRDCHERCSCPSCHHVTGICDTCPHGYFGDSCTEPCSSDRWGQGCNSTCICPTGERCDVFTGQCSQESSDDSSTTEWQSLKPIPTTTDETDVTELLVVLSLGLPGLLALILFVCILVWVCKLIRRRAAERSKTFTGSRPPTTVMEQVNNLKQLEQFNQPAEIQIQQTTPRRNISDALPNIPPTGNHESVPSFSSDGYTYLFRR